MATNQPTNAPVNEFHLYDIVATEIADTFNRLIEQLTARRDALLTKLQTIKEDFVTKETTRIAAIAELERVIRQTREEISMKVNVNLEVQEKVIQVYQDEMEQHQTPTKLPHPFFSYPTLLHLQTQIAEFGEVREWELDYSLKKQPVLSVGKQGKANDELYLPRGLALDEPNQLIYIADWDNRIQVVSFAGKFLERFGQGIFKEPWGIAVTEDNVYVTNYNPSALFQFSKKDYQLVRRTGTEGRGEGQLDHPSGLCIDYNTDVYVADHSNNRVSVFSKDLKFLNCLYMLINPKDVKVTLSCIVVLDSSPNCIHFFSRSGDLIRSCVTQGEDGMVYSPWFFCLDPAGNILIADYNHHSIKILSPSGHLIHKIGKRGHGRGELICPEGICLSETGTIFVVSFSDNFGLQSF